MKRFYSVLKDDFCHADYFLAALASAAGSVLSSALSSYSTSKANAQTAASNERINRQQIEYAKNANSYAVADRMRAGLSPLDSQPSETPALSGTDYKSTDYTSLGQGLANAVEGISQRQVNQSVVNANNAKAQDDRESAFGKNIENTTNLATLGAKISSLQAEYQNITDKGSTEAKIMKQQVENLEQTYKNLQAENENIRADTSLKNSANALNVAQTDESRKRTEHIKEQIFDEQWNRFWFQRLDLPTGTSLSADWKTTEVYRVISGLQDVISRDVPGAIAALESAGTSISGVLQQAYEAAKNAGIKGASAIKQFIKNHVENAIASAMAR